MFPITKRQSEALSFIKAALERTGQCPSMAEIADGIGLASRSGVHGIINALEERGHIQRLHGRARAIRVVDYASGDNHG